MPTLGPFPLDVLGPEHHGRPGRLALGFAPGRMAGRWETRDLEVDLNSLRNDHGIQHLVSLVETQELEALGIPDLLQRARELGLQSHHWPMPDGEAPRDPAILDELVTNILTWLERGENVFLHCWAGLGRTGTIATACLIAAGMSYPEALRRVRALRPGSVETRAQEAFLERYAQWRRSKEPTP